HRRAANAKSAADRHQAAFFLCEASLGLLGCSAAVTCAGRPGLDPTLSGGLTRPPLARWWGLARSLVPALAEAGDAGFRPVRDLLLAPIVAADLPRVAELGAALGELLPE